MQKDYYEPMEPKPINEEGEVPHGQTGTGSRMSSSDGSSGGMTDQARDMAGRAQERAGEMAEQAQEKAGNVATMARERTDQGKEKAAEGMQTAAEKIRERSESREGMQAQVGTRVADTLEKTSGYLREHDTNEMWDDFESFVRENPMQAAAGALVAGFVLGRILR